jgi:hypothetical protein
MAGVNTIFIVLALSHLIAGATYKETRKVTDGSGKKFTCTYSLFYTTKTVSKAKSSVSCTPNTKGKSMSQEFVIESLGKTVTVKHAIKKGKDTISNVSLKDYVAPTTSAPAPPPVPGEAMDCTCRLPGMDQTVMGRNGFQFEMKGDAASDRKVMKPTALTRGRGGGHYGGGHHGGGHHGGYGGVSHSSGLLSSIIPLALTAILAGLVAFGGTTLLTTLINLFLQTTVNIIGRKLPIEELAESENDQARLLAKLNDRQLFGNLLGNIQAPAPAPANPLLGLLGGSNGGTGGVDLGSLLGGAGGSSGTSDLVNQIAMQVVQQQIEDFVNNGGAEAAMTDFVESGKMEEMMGSMMESAMENINTEEFMENIQSNLEESFGEVEGGFDDLMNEANFEEMMNDFKLEDMMAGMNMTELMDGMDLSTMELQMQCSCVPSATR